MADCWVNAYIQAVIRSFWPKVERWDSPMSLLLPTVTSVQPVSGLIIWLRYGSKAKKGLMMMCVMLCTFHSTRSCHLPSIWYWSFGWYKESRPKILGIQGSSYCCHQSLWVRNKTSLLVMTALIPLDAKLMVHLVPCPVAYIQRHDPYWLGC